MSSGKTRQPCVNAKFNKQSFAAGRRGGFAYGGAIYGSNNLKIYNSTFTNNSAIAGDGGAIPPYPFTLGVNGGEALGGTLMNSSGSDSVILNSVFNNLKHAVRKVIDKPVC